MRTRRPRPVEGRRPRQRRGWGGGSSFGHLLASHRGDTTGVMHGQPSTPKGPGRVLVLLTRAQLLGTGGTRPGPRAVVFRTHHVDGDAALRMCRSAVYPELSTARSLAETRRPQGRRRGQCGLKLPQIARAPRHWPDRLLSPSSRRWPPGQARISTPEYVTSSARNNARTLINWSPPTITWSWPTSRRARFFRYPPRSQSPRRGRSPGHGHPARMEGGCWWPGMPTTASGRCSLCRSPPPQPSTSQRHRAEQTLIPAIVTTRRSRTRPTGALGRIREAAEVLRGQLLRPGYHRAWSGYR